MPRAASLGSDIFYMSHSGHVPKFSCSSCFSGHMLKFVPSQHLWCFTDWQEGELPRQTTLVCHRQARGHSMMAETCQGLWGTPGHPAAPLPLKSPFALHLFKVYLRGRVSFSCLHFPLKRYYWNTIKQTTLKESVMVVIIMSNIQNHVIGKTQ